MGIFDSLRGKQPEPPPTAPESSPEIANDPGIVFSPHDGTKVSRPDSLPPEALWTNGPETRMSADETHFPEVFRSLSVGSLCVIELTRGRRRGWRKPIVASSNGTGMGVFGYHPIRDQFGAVVKRERRIFVPAIVKEINGKKMLVAYMCSDTALAAWLHMYGKKADADYMPPTVELSLGTDGFHYEEARTLLGKRERHTFRAKLAVEEVTEGEDAGQSRVVVTARKMRALEISPSQRERMPELFALAERGARGAITLRIGSNGELTGRIAAY